MHRCRRITSSQISHAQHRSQAASRTVNPVATDGRAIRLEPASALRRRSSLLGVLQNDAAPMIVDDPPFFDLLKGSKTAQAGQVVV